MSNTSKPQKPYREKQNSYSMSVQSFALPARNRSMRAFIIIPGLVIFALNACYYIFRHVF